jgi:hypothetical protein
MTPAPLIPPASNPAPRREECVREVLLAAEGLRQTGQTRRLRELTIVLPTDYRAVEALELACQVLAEGDFSQAARDLDGLIDRLGTEPAQIERFLQSLRGVIRRLNPDDWCI